ncbi:hypothetical protein Tsubulata_014889 [Turnera subulata]|uniref:MBD domain-containing protein n=1 Tax=Turnera subulata TaxID=218843 RepID=A0A9Q0JHE3_9ROSI|nr:hypothetical protein Tsubulata_014889 [Turnera subulata]
MGQEVVIIEDDEIPVRNQNENMEMGQELVIIEDDESPMWNQNENIENESEAIVPILDSISPQTLPRTQKEPRFYEGPTFGLPKEWMVEVRPRQSRKYIGRVDQFYYESNTGRQFRSKKSVVRYLAEKSMLERQENEAPETTEPMPLLLDNSSKTPWGADSHSSNMTNTSTSSSDLTNSVVPEAVTWVLTDAQNDIWTPTSGEVNIPGHTMAQWAEAFDSNFNARN